eukprot:TRINITY_DN1886_c0_g2_i2.p1 TRINITY_DN1886_c0_g2~~TRINITY_DN1886_c0_g2_i2.p1  ORF type:complete len:815 (+),score=112.34 TRINITY_DN1886_c0_g2_i2:135-2447(+)
MPSDHQDHEGAPDHQDYQDHTGMMLPEHQDHTGAMPPDHQNHTGAMPSDHQDHAGMQPQARRQQEHAGTMPPDHQNHTGMMPSDHQNHIGTMPPDHQDHTGAMPPDHQEHTGMSPPDHQDHAGAPDHQDHQNHTGGMPSDHQEHAGASTTDHQNHTGTMPTDHQDHTGAMPPDHQEHAGMPTPDQQEHAGAMPPDHQDHQDHAGAPDDQNHQDHTGAMPPDHQDHAGMPSPAPQEQTGALRPPGEKSCRACPAGKLKARFGPEECVTCQKGRWAGIGATKCDLCGDGEVPSEDQSRCEHCPLGLRSVNNTCRTCPKGSVPDDTSRFCVSCPNNTFAQPGDHSCEKCPGFWPLMVDNECYYSHKWFLAGALIVLLLIIWLLCIYCKRRRKARELQELQEALRARKEERDWKGLWAYKHAHVRAKPLKLTRKERAVNEVLEEVHKQSTSLGISITYVLGAFRERMKELVEQSEWRQGPYGPWLLQSCILAFGGSLEAPPAEWRNADKADAPNDPNFIQIAPLVAFGPDAPGFNLICPRDGEEHCSIVDAVFSQGDSGEANQFLSWVWQYRVSTVVEALTAWSNEAHIVFQEDEGCVTRIISHHEKVSIWWCFFCNNQYRILADCHKKSTKELSDAFGLNVRRVGKMWMLLDDLHEPMYLSRIWCIFEVFVARKYDVPCRAIVSHGFGTHPIEKIDELFDTCKVDAAAARASMKEDEDGIKNLIEDEFGSFDAVNLAVERQLNMVVLDSLRRERNNQGNTPTITLEYTDVFGI